MNGRVKINIADTSYILHQLMEAHGYPTDEDDSYDIYTDEFLETRYNTTFYDFQQLLSDLIPFRMNLKISEKNTTTTTNED